MFLDSVRVVSARFATITDGLSLDSESLIGRLRSNVAGANDELRSLCDDYEKRFPIFPQSKRTAAAIHVER